MGKSTINHHFPSPKTGPVGSHGMSWDPVKSKVLAADRSLEAFVPTTVQAQGASPDIPAEALEDEDEPHFAETKSLGNIFEIF